MTLRVIIGAIALIFGAVWIAQGTGVLPVGFMANQMEWAYAGIVAVVVGLVLIATGRRRTAVDL